MSSAAVRALVSGYPRRLWGVKYLALLQAYTDDSESNTGDHRLVLAAYVMNANQWIEFSDDWDAALREEPAIEYFHMVEAQNRRDQFKGWSEHKRNDKVRRLAEVIEEWQPVSVDCYLNAAVHRRVMKPYAPHGMQSPYFPLVFALACGVARVCQHLDAPIPCDFIFDKQDNVSKHVKLFWEYIIGKQPPEWGKFINDDPIFRDKDKDPGFVALQAADMLAWHTRRKYEGSYPHDYDGIIELIRHKEFSYSLEVADSVLEEWGEGMRRIRGENFVASKAEWNAVIERIVGDGFPSEEHRAAIERDLGRA